MKPQPTPWPTLRQKLATWYAKAKRDLPWRRTRDPYAITLSEVMLQQTQVVTVIPYYERWLKLFPTWEALAAAKEHDVIKAWEGLGYYRRARHLQAAEALGADTSRAQPDDAGRVLSDHLVKLMSDLRIPNGLRALGYDSHDIPALVAGTLPQHRVTKLSPRPAGPEELALLFEESLTCW